MFRRDSDGHREYLFTLNCNDSMAFLLKAMEMYEAMGEVDVMEARTGGFAMNHPHAIARKKRTKKRVRKNKIPKWAKNLAALSGFALKKIRDVNRVHPPVATIVVVVDAEFVPGRASYYQVNMLGITPEVLARTLLVCAARRQQVAVQRVVYHGS